MKIRLQHIYILLALAAIVTCLFMPLIQFIYSDYTSVTMSNFHIQHIDGTSSSSPWGLGCLLVVVGICQLFTLFVSLFQNFALQKRSLIFSILILTGWYIVYLIFLLILKKDANTMQPSWSSVLPLISIILSFMAFNAIRHTEAKIIESGNSFRLRD